jgi:hypothetical protein
MAGGGAGSGLGAGGGESLNPFTRSTSDWDGYASATYSTEDEEEQPTRAGNSAIAAAKPVKRARSRRLLFRPRMLTRFGLVRSRGIHRDQTVAISS